MHPMQSAFERLQLPTVLESRPLPDAIITEIAKCEPPVFEFCDQQQQQPSGSLSRDIPTSLKPKMLSYLLLWNVALAYLKARAFLFQLEPAITVSCKPYSLYSISLYLFIVCRVYSPAAIRSVAVGEWSAPALYDLCVQDAA